MAASEFRRSLLILLKAGGVGAALLGTYFLAQTLLGNWIFDVAEFNVRMQENYLSRKDRPPAKILILGDSTAAANFTARFLDGFSLGLYRATSIETYYLFKRYLEREPQPECVILSLAYNFDHYIVESFGIFINIGFYSDDELDEIYLTSYKMNEFPAKDFNPLEFGFFHLKSRLYLDLSGLERIQRLANPSALSKRLKRFEAMARQFNFRHGNFSLQSSQTNISERIDAYLKREFTELPLYDVYLKRVLSLAREKGITVNFVRGPISETGLDQKAEAYFEKLGEHLRNIFAEYPEHQLIFEEKRYPASKMINLTHLNAQGAKDFTYEIQPLLKCGKSPQ